MSPGDGSGNVKENTDDNDTVHSYDIPTSIPANMLMYYRTNFTSTIPIKYHYVTEHDVTQHDTTHHQYISIHDTTQYPYISHHDPTQHPYTSHQYDTSQRQDTTAPYLASVLV